MFNGENDNNVKVSLETLKKFVYNNNIRLIKSPVRKPILVVGKLKKGECNYEKKNSEVFKW